MSQAGRRLHSGGMFHDASTEILDEAECWRLLGESEYGRLAISIMNRPDVFPINHVVDSSTLVFRTAEGTKLAGAVLGSGVAFEVDGITEHCAWSVVVKGRAVEIDRPEELFAALDLSLHPWNTAPKHRYVRIIPDEVTGRRFPVAEEGAVDQ